MDFRGLIENILNNFLSFFATIIIGIAVLMFFYGLFNYVSNSGDESKRKESVQYIIYGLIGIFVMIAVWGLVGLITDFIGEDPFVPFI